MGAALPEVPGAALPRSCARAHLIGTHSDFPQVLRTDRLTACGQHLGVSIRGDGGLSALLA